ncbi:ComF family protein [Persicimonas caeni]|nr:ComF family protein [Persicimonas caeni]
MKLPPRLRTIVRFALRQVFPARCVSCDDYLTEDQLACGRCAHAVFPIEGPKCLVCGAPRLQVEGTYSGVDEICGRCLARRPRFETARARWEYAGVIAEALQRAKYQGHLWMLRSLARAWRPWIDERIARASDEVDSVITAVPMHAADLRARGFNPAHLLARLALPHRHVASDLVRKTVRTRAQAALSRDERLTNLRGAFECTNSERVEGNKVVLIDDVMTTGATADEVARVLRGAGAREVVVLTAARTLPS